MMNGWVKWPLFFVSLGTAAWCHAGVVIERYETVDFNPSLGEVFAIPVKIEQPGKIDVELYSADRDLVRSLSSGEKEKAGIYEVHWDGKDESGAVVPDEAYFPVVIVTATNKSDNAESIRLDPSSTSGGEEISVSPEITEGQISFRLQRPSRILARAGIQSGPMMKSFVNWEVRGAGKNVLVWDGFDHDGIVNLYDQEQHRLALLVTGYELPNHSILTIGNKLVTYGAWRKSKGWSSEMPDLSRVQLERKGRRISRHYYLPRSVDVAPDITLDITNKLRVNEDGIPIVSSPISLKVGMHDDDRWAMQQSLYEVAFFVDYQFLSEEEQGYVPLTWRWNPAGLEPGTHIITVNVSGFNGQVGVKSLKIEIPE